VASVARWRPSLVRSMPRVTHGPARRGPFFLVAQFDSANDGRNKLARQSVLNAASINPGMASVAGSLAPRKPLESWGVPHES
jgi:hypothetical protein